MTSRNRHEFRPSYKKATRAVRVAFQFWQRTPPSKQAEEEITSNASGAAIPAAGLPQAAGYGVPP